MRRYSNLRAITLSFFSKDLYVDVARHWLGVGIVYLLLVTVLTMLPLLIWMQAGLGGWAHGEAGSILAQLPKVVIHDGRLSSPVVMPYVIRDDHHRAVAIIDTTGQVASLDSTEAQVLATSTRIFYRKSASETRVFELARISHFELDREKVRRWLGLAVIWFVPLVSPFVFGGVFILRLCQVLLLAAAGIPVSGSRGGRLGYPALMRLAAVAFTPTFVLDMLRTVGVKVPQWWLLSIVIAAVYLVFGIAANRDAAPASQEMAPPAAV